MSPNYTFLYLVWVQFSGEIDFCKVSYLRNTRIWIIAVNYSKTSKFNKVFEFSTISPYYSYNVYNNMFLLVSHYPDFLITSCICAFENHVQPITLYILRFTPAAQCSAMPHGTLARPIWTAICAMPRIIACKRTRFKFCRYVKRKLLCWSFQFGQGLAGWVREACKIRHPRMRVCKVDLRKHRWTPAQFCTVLFVSVLRGAEQLAWSRLVK